MVYHRANSGPIPHGCRLLMQTNTKGCMSFAKLWLLAAFCLCPNLLPAQDTNQDKPADTFLSKIKWVKGPAQADLKSIAQIQVPDGYIFANAGDTRKLMEALGNHTSGAEAGFLAPASFLGTNLSDWFMVFEFSDIGYVKDDDKDKLNADKLLKAYKDGTEEENKYREKNGVPPMHITGWEIPPRYNSETHNLEWAIRAEVAGDPVVNFNTKLLGRKGVMEVDLVVDPTNLTAALPAYQSLLAGYSFKQGETYAEYRQGDKLAKYGLAGLITAGAAVVAVKTGLFTLLLVIVKKAWYLMVAAFAAVVNFFKRLVQGGGRRKSTLE
jgi:uncharacterized membrane-anchored protein